jgi:hypothetical protein
MGKLVIAGMVCDIPFAKLSPPTDSAKTYTRKSYDPEAALHWHNNQT